MGQYYLGYIKHGEERPKVFDCKVDGEWQGLKLMEHSYWLNDYVGNAFNDLYHDRGRLCWVGDYYDEGDFAQANCGKDEVKAIGEFVWGKDGNEGAKREKSTRKNARYPFRCAIVNHTKKLILMCDEYYAKNATKERWNGEEWEQCIHPLPLLACSASHSGGSYHGTSMDDCGTWFNDEIEVVLDYEAKPLLDEGYKTVMYEFRETR